jgi:phosphopantothenoylcysteine synthetase/decarboxylase
MPDGYIIIATTNLGSKGTFPIAQEFKQRGSIIEVRYGPDQMKKILYKLFTRDAMKVELGYKLYEKTSQFAKEGRNGWNYPASVRTVKDFVTRLMLGFDFNLTLQESVYQSIKSVLIQFTDESSVFIQRRNEDLGAELEKDTRDILEQYVDKQA